MIGRGARGLGQSVTATPAIDCSGWDSVFRPSCWADPFQILKAGAAASTLPPTPYGEYLLTGNAPPMADDLSGAVAELDKMRPYVGPTGGGTFQNLVDTVATDYQGTIPAGYVPPVGGNNFMGLLIVGGVVFLLMLGGH